MATDEQHVRCCTRAIQWSCSCSKRQLVRRIGGTIAIPSTHTDTPSHKKETPVPAKTAGLTPDTGRLAKGHITPPMSRQRIVRLFLIQCPGNCHQRVPLLLVRRHSSISTRACSEMEWFMLVPLRRWRHQHRVRERARGSVAIVRGSFRHVFVVFVGVECGKERAQLVPGELQEAHRHTKNWVSERVSE